jgi:UMF1 family MFS transporter
MSAENLNFRAQASWILYDWANSAFALTVLAAFFPVFFRQYWCSGHDSSFTTAKLGFGNAIAGILIALSAPILGSLADKGHARKRFLVFFMICGALFTAVFPFIAQGNWVNALTLFIIANFCWSGANLFYDSLLPEISEPREMDFISSAGFSVGYIGCAILFAINIVMISNPSLFGLKNASQAVKASFLSVSVWWFIFSIPLILFVKEEGTVSGIITSIRGIRTSIKQIGRTAREIWKIRQIRIFLAAYWLYIDGVDTFIRMAADLGLSIGLDAKGLMVSLLIVQIVAFPCALCFGFIARKKGAWVSLLAGIGIYLFITIAGPVWVKTTFQYRIMAVLSAVPLGCLQALSRSYFAKIIPAERSAEFFGFYNLMGKFAAIFGPMIVGVTAFILEVNGVSGNLSARYGFCSISLLFAVGGILLFISGTESRQVKSGI